MRDELFAILNKDPQRNIAILGFFRHYPLDSQFRESNAIMALGKSDHLWAHLVCDNEADLILLLKKHIHHTKYYSSVEDWMIPVILENGELDWLMSTERFILEGTTHIEIPGYLSETEILSSEDALHIFNHSDYKAYTSVSYIKDRINCDISSCIRYDGRPVAWGFTHDDGSLGFLHVLPEYREKGYAKAILLDLIGRKRERYEPVFCNIVAGNLAPLNLVKKLGFKADRKVSWLKLK